MRNDRSNVIVDLTFKFAISIVKYCEELESKKKFVIAKQLLKSGTSIGANIREAQNAESKNDFIHKFKIAAKECDETIYWLAICKEIDSYPFDDNLTEQIEVISKVMSKILVTSKTSNFDLKCSKNLFAFERCL
jgi:four helix bundle protein